MYGRRLVLEWAAQDESIDDLRAKTARLASASRGNEGDGDSQGNSTKKKLQRYFQTRPAKANNDEEDDDE